MYFWHVACAREPGNRDVGILSEQGRPIGGATVDLPAIRVQRSRFCPDTVGESNDGDVPNLARQMVAIGCDPAVAGFAERGLTTGTNIRVEFFVRFDCAICTKLDEAGCLAVAMLVVLCDGSVVRLRGRRQIGRGSASWREREEARVVDLLV